MTSKWSFQSFDELSFLDIGSVSRDKKHTNGKGYGSRFKWDDVETGNGCVTRLWLEGWADVSTVRVSTSWCTQDPRYPDGTSVLPCVCFVINRFQPFFSKILSPKIDIFQFLVNEANCHVPVQEREGPRIQFHFPQHYHWITGCIFHQSDRVIEDR